jgi:signal transduction histidine kinase/CheY-like chemotaxis protein/integral membrane sensor domain MASE1
MWFAAWTAAYFAVGVFGLSSLFRSTPVAPVVLTSGVLLAALLLTPRPARLRMALLLGAADFIVDRLYGSWGPIAHALIAVILVLEAWTAVLVAEHLGGDRVAKIGRVRDVAVLLIGALTGSAAGGMLGALVLVSMAPMGFATAFVQWWAPDFVAYTTVAPALLTAAAAFESRVTMSLARRAEFVVVLSLTWLGCWYVQSGWTALGGRPAPLTVAMLPLLGWAAVRLGTVGTTWTTLLMGGVSVFYTLEGGSLFSGLTDSLVGQLLWTQVFTVTVGLSMLALAAALAERQSSLAAAAAALDESHRAAERFRAFFDGTSEMLAVVDRELRLVMCTSAWSRSYAEWFGTAPRLGTRLDQPSLAASRATMCEVTDGWRRAVAGERVSLAHRVTPPGRSEVEIERLFVPLRDLTGEIIGATESVRDVAEIRQRQANEARARRLESIGQLAGGVAHDFNNIVSAILGYAEVVDQSLPASDPLHADVAEITRAGERAARLTGQLLAYARRQVIEPRVVHVPALLAGLEPMLKTLLGEHITTRWILSPETKAVRVDPGQLEQVVVNLAINARDAMPEGGRLTIACDNVRLDPHRVRTLAPGDYVTIVVSDTGEGMTPDVRERVFEPFFTTKGTGRGTGLGLATAEGIITQAGGAIVVESAVGAGTTFTVYLPQTQAEDMPALPTSVSGDFRGSERILLVEDDDALRALSARVLREQGYTVVEAANAGEATALDDATLRSCSLLLSDVVLPDVNGAVAAERLSQRHRALRVLFISGYVENGARQGLPAGAPLLMKPFPPDALLRRVRATLDGQSTYSR